jgi:molecular chaperone GrpE
MKLVDCGVVLMSEKNKKDWKKFKEEHAEQEILAGEEVIDDEELDENTGALEHLSYAELEEKLTLVEQQAHENWEKSVRATAELENVRRRSEREITNAHRYGIEKLINSLLPVVDSLEEALRLADKSGDTGMHEGLELTMKLFLDVFDKHDVEQLDPQGAAFDPQEHEAMSVQPSDEAPNNSVLMVFQKGYKLAGRVIRPARVIVAKSP